MHRHEMQQSNIYLGIYIIVYYFLLQKSVCYKGEIEKLSGQYLGWI
jgi:hypothetical protein